MTHKRQIGAVAFLCGGSNLQACRFSGYNPVNDVTAGVAADWGVARGTTFLNTAALYPLLYVIQCGFPFNVPSRLRCQDAVLSPSCRQAQDVGWIQKPY